MEIAFQTASLDDLPVLAEIMSQAYMRETVSQIAFNNWPDVENMLVFFTARVKERMSTSDTQVFKAVYVATGAITGYVSSTLQKEEQEKPEPNEAIEKQDPTQHAIEQIPDFLNLEFIKSSGGDIELMKKRMGRDKHYCKLFRYLSGIHWLHNQISQPL